eukprot:5093549-Pyramimonas_sp.AAC.1
MKRLRELQQGLGERSSARGDPTTELEIGHDKSTGVAWRKGRRDASPETTRDIFCDPGAPATAFMTA